MVVEALDLRAGPPQIDPGRADADGGKLDRLRQTSPEAQSTSARFEADDPQGYTQPALPPEGECTADDPALVQHHEHQRMVLRKALREVVKTPFVMRDALAHLTGNDVKRPAQLRKPYSRASASCADHSVTGDMARNFSDAATSPRAAARWSSRAWRRS